MEIKRNYGLSSVSPNGRSQGQPKIYSRYESITDKFLLFADTNVNWNDNDNGMRKHHINPNINNYIGDERRFGANSHRFKICLIFCITIQLVSMALDLRRVVSAPWRRVWRRVAPNPLVEKWWRNGTKTFVIFFLWIMANRFK